MEFSKFFGAMELLWESLNLLPKNGKIMALLALLYLIISSISMLIFSFSAKSLLHDMIVKGSIFPISISKSSELITLLGSFHKDTGLLLIVYVLLLVAYYIISFLSTISTILLSAISYGDQTISVTKLLMRVLKSWKGPLITGIYIMLLELGYFWFFLFIASPILYYSASSSIVIFIIFMIAYICYLYSSVGLVLAIVISVMEENCFGIAALGKAETIVEGKRIHGFVLNVILNVIALIVFQGFRIISGYQWLVNSTSIAFVILSISCSLKIFQSVTFTVFYFHCKRNHGEEIELEDSIDSVEYNKISAALMGNEVFA